MKPTTSGAALMAVSVENPASEIEDVEGLVERYRARVLRFVFASVRDMDVAETLTQDCFFKAHRARHGFRGDCSVQTWLMRIAVNLIRDHARRRRFRFWEKLRSLGEDTLHEWPDRAPSPEDTLSLRQQVQAVWHATGSLSEKQRTVFLLRFVEELEIDEIAQSIGMTVNAVNVNLFRAVRSIRKRVGGRQRGS
jgi:RNA polymerase sigma-70 factor, ECF subfamily